MAEGVLLEKGTARRVFKVVRQIEGEPLNLVGKRRKRPSTSGASSSPYNFQVTKTGDTTVTVRAGRWIRYGAGFKNIVEMGIDGGGTSGDYNDVITLNGINTNGWIVLVLPTSRQNMSKHQNKK